MQTGATTGLRETANTQLVQQFPAHVRDIAYSVEWAVRHRVEIDAPLVRLLDLGTTGVPGVELDGRHLYGPDDLGEFGDAEFVGGAFVAREEDAHGVHPLGRAVRQPFLVHLLPGDAGGEAVQHARTVAQRPHDAVTDRQVVVDEIELRLAPSREVDPVGVRDRHDALADLDLDLGGAAVPSR